MGTPSNDLNITQAGLVAFDGVATFTGRTLTAGAGVTITNGSGVAGNPTISVTGGAPVHGTGTDNHIVRWDGTGVPVIQDGVAIETDAGAIQAGNGSTALPAFTFVTDPDTGFYRLGANNPGVSAGNTSVANWTTTQTNLTSQLIATASTDTTHILTRNTAATGSATQVLSILLGCTGTSAVGFGPSIEFQGEDNAGTLVDFGRLEYRATDIVAGTIDTRTVFRVVSNSVSAIAMDIDATQIKGNSGALTTPTFSFISDTNTGIYNSATDTLALVANGKAIQTLDGTGTPNVLTTDAISKNTTQPAFLAYLATDDNDKTGNGAAFTLGSATALTEVFDQGSNFNTNGTFTAPTTGRYMLSAGATVMGTTIATIFVLQIVTSNRTYQVQYTRAASAVNMAPSMTVIADMDLNDTATATITVFGEAGNTADIDGTTNPVTYFSGYLLC